MINLSEDESMDLPLQMAMPFAELKIPQAWHYVNKPQGRFTCSKCSRSYRRKDSLQRHVQWECGKEPQFVCPYCPQRCKRKAHWQRHIRRQHKDKADMERYLGSSTSRIEIDWSRPTRCRSKGWFLSNVKSRDKNPRTVPLGIRQRKIEESFWCMRDIFLVTFF